MYQVTTALAEAMQYDVDDAWKQIATIEERIWISKDEVADDEEYRFAEECLLDVLHRIDLRIRGVLDLAVMDASRAAYDRRISELGGIGVKLDVLWYVGALVSPVLEVQNDVWNVLMGLLGDPATQQQADKMLLLEQILRGTPKMIKDRSLMPSKEAEVRQEVYNTMLHVFPDTMREVPIPKVSKTYKPDLGVRSLKVAIEYKFADTEQDLKTCLGGIFEDIHGYAGSDDWTHFYAVIYTTEHFMTQSQLDAECGQSKVPKNWKFILVTGDGSRVKRFTTTTRKKKSAPTKK